MDTVHRENKTTSNIIQIKAGYDSTNEFTKKYSKLPEFKQKEIFSMVVELFLSEPQKRGKQPTRINSLYHRLSVASKKEVTKQINKVLGIKTKNDKPESTPKTVATNNVIMLNFKKTRGKNKETRTVCDSFVTYETDWCFGFKGYLRHKFNCKDKSKANLDNLIQDMEISLKNIACEVAIKNDPKYHQCANSRTLGIPISQTVTEAQRRILRRIQSTCESELLIDLCNDNTIRVKNNWNEPFSVFWTLFREHILRLNKLSRICS